MGHRDARDHPVDPGGFLPAETRVLQIDVMHDLGDRPKCGVLQREPVQEVIERATMSLMRELGLEHVEPNLAWRGAIAARRHELEPGLRVDEPSYQPGARYPVDMDP